MKSLDDFHDVTVVTAPRGETGSRVLLDGQPLRGVTKVETSSEGKLPPVVTVTLIARSLNHTPAEEDGAGLTD